MEIRPFEFTKRSQKTNETIRQWLETICETILKEIPGTRAILLTGGFSRGEGPVKVEKGRICPYNDFDITAVCERPVSKEKADEVAVKASKAIGLRGIEYFYSFRKSEQKMEDNFYVDLKAITVKQLPGLLPRIRNFELRNHSLLLYGEDLRKRIPDYKISEIPLSEPAKILLDRMSQMTEYFSTKGEYDEEFLTYIIQQAYAACNSALLFLSGKIRIGYSEAARIMHASYQKDFPELAKKLPGLNDRILKYIEWKAKPDKLPQKDVSEAWFACREDLLEVSKYFFSRFTGKRIETVPGLCSAISSMAWRFHRPYLEPSFGSLSALAHPFAVFFLKWKYFKRVRRMAGNHMRIFWSGSPDMAIFSVAPLVMMCLNRDHSVDERMFRKAVETLGRAYHVSGIKDWEGLSMAYANAYIAFFLMKIQ